MLFLQIAFLLVSGTVVGLFARRIGLPRVAGELVAGILIGPSLIGSHFPVFGNWLTISTDSHRLINYGLILFLFSVGSHVDLASVSRLRRRITLTSLGGIALPFALGYAAVSLAPSIWRPFASGDLHTLALFMGTVLSISALPVIAKILRDLDLLDSDIGSVVMASATVDDLVGWCLFAVVVSHLGKAVQPVATVTIVFALAAIIVLLGRHMTSVLLRRIPAAVAVIVKIAIAFALAQLTDVLGLGTVFGAFLAGMAFSNGEEKDLWNRGLNWLANEICAPVYFVSVGLQANFVHSFSLTLFLIVMAIASIGKVVGATAGARLGGASKRDAIAVGFGLNARGTMAIVLVSTALAAHVVTEPVFVAVVAMSLATSLISGPVMIRMVGPIATSSASSDSAT